MGKKSRDGAAADRFRKKQQDEALEMAVRKSQEKLMPPQAIDWTVLKDENGVVFSMTTDPQPFEMLTLETLKKYRPAVFGTNFLGNHHPRLPPSQATKPMSNTFLPQIPISEAFHALGFKRKLEPLKYGDRVVKIKFPGEMAFTQHKNGDLTVPCALVTDDMLRTGDFSEIEDSLETNAGTVEHEIYEDYQWRMLNSWHWQFHEVAAVATNLAKQDGIDPKVLWNSFQPSNSTRFCAIQWPSLNGDSRCFFQSMVNDKSMAGLHAWDIWRVDEFREFMEFVQAKHPQVSGLRLEELDKVVLSDAARRSIVATLKQSQHSKKIFEEWGLGETIPYGRGMTMLFYGPPGTGKTWAAECIAKALGKKLHVVETAALQTSEPGGFERTAKVVFAEATKKRQVLFFDECDSMLMSREGMGPILSAEINCLLTEAERYEGFAIFATNRNDELDPALARRISTIIEFPEPDAGQRLEIWKKLVPAKMPTEGLDLKELADAYRMTGGYIKNAVLSAARFAVADDREVVTMDDFRKGGDQALENMSAIDKKKRSVLHGYQVVQKAVGSGHVHVKSPPVLDEEMPDKKERVRRVKELAKKD